MAVLERTSTGPHSHYCSAVSAQATAHTQQLCARVWDVAVDRATHYRVTMRMEAVSPSSRVSGYVAPPRRPKTGWCGGDGEEAAEEGDEEPRCSICLDPFLPGQFLRSLPCKHFFHVNCIDEWLTTSSRCCPEDAPTGPPELEEADTEDENGAEDDGSGGGNLAHRLGLRYACEGRRRAAGGV